MTQTCPGCGEEYEVTADRVVWFGSDGHLYCRETCVRKAAQ